MRTILATPEMALDLEATCAGDVTQRWLTPAECHELDVSNGIVIHPESPIWNAGLDFPKNSFSKIHFTVVAPSDEDVRVRLSSRSKRVYGEVLESLYLHPSEVSSFCVDITGHSYIALSILSKSTQPCYVVNISFEE